VGTAGSKGQKGANALGTTIDQLPTGGFEFDPNNSLLYFTSGSFTGVVLMFRSGSN
jgi:hypothetical protein